MSWVSLVDRSSWTTVAIGTFQLAMRALGFEPRREEIKNIISTHVKDDSDFITLEQFMNIMSEKILDKGAKEEIMKAFRLFDDDQTGKISFKNLKRVAQELGENLTEEELREMIQEADQDKDGEVNQDEFLRIMKKTCLYWIIIPKDNDKQCWLPLLLFFLLTVLPFYSSKQLCLFYWMFECLSKLNIGIWRPYIRW